MKDVKTDYFPDCDMCIEAGAEWMRLGRYNSPTKLGPWANLCEQHMGSIGIDTSVTERRVHPDGIPFEALAIARAWSGRKFRIAAVSGPGTEPDAWRFWEPEDGFVYEAYRPGAQFPVFEDSGRPCGFIVKVDAWCVRCTNDAPDSWFTVGTDGVKHGYREEVRVW